MSEREQPGNVTLPACHTRNDTERIRYTQSSYDGRGSLLTDTVECGSEVPTRQRGTDGALRELYHTIDQSATMLLASTLQPTMPHSIRSSRAGPEATIAPSLVLIVHSITS